MSEIALAHSVLWNTLLPSYSPAPEGTGGATAAERLIELARQLGAEDAGNSRVSMTEGFGHLISAATELAPHLSSGPSEQSSAGEVRSFYSIALEMFPHPEAVQLIIDRSSPGALRGLESDFPEVHRHILEHVAQYGWLPLRSRPLAMNPKQIAQRLQKVFLRWKATDVEALAAGAPEGESAAPLSTDLLLQAQSLATPFLDRLAVAVKCAPEDLTLCTPDEIAAALRGSGALPVAEMQARRKSMPAPLTGQAVSLGRAVGRVRIIGRAAEGTALQFGDVVVTGLSSPDHGGAASIFPTRTEAAVDIHKAVAIVIDDGGLLSHAAMISRENGIPCIVGTERGTTCLTEGQYVEIDATKGDGKVLPF